ncbi:MAG: hypothetical protein NT069_24245, partial [Planctomycetota bacterium]|nr:hypothetical protein [Planctomycetota bacterium]
TAGSEVNFNGVTQPATRQATFVRLVVPVEQVERTAPNNLPKLNEQRVPTAPPPTNPQQADPGDRNSRFD